MRTLQFFTSLTLMILLGNVEILAPIPEVIAQQISIREIAQNITVRIEGANSRGSGILIEKEGETYYVITNAHVVKQMENYAVITPDRRRHAIAARDVRIIAGVDLAVLSFRSSTSYQIAAINSESLNIGQKVYVAGWPRSGGSLRQPVFTYTEGSLKETLSKLPQGYSLTYTNLVRAGMSGGPILDARGRLIGINGLVRLADNTDKIVASGISINTFLNWRSRDNPNKPLTNTSPTAINTSNLPSQQGFGLIKKVSIGRGSVNSLVFSTADLQILVSGDSEGKISIWKLNQGEKIRNWQGHRGGINAIALSKDGKILASGGEDRKINLWNIETGKLIASWEGHENAITSLGFSGNSQQLVSGSWDKTIKIWHVSSGKLLNTLKGHSQLVTCLQISQDGKILASGSQDGSIRLWNLNNGKLLRTLQANGLAILSMAIVSDNRTLISGGSDGTVVFWNLSQGEIIKKKKEHLDGVWSLGIVGNALVSGSWDKTVKLWDVKKGEAIATLNGNKDYVISVAIAKDGKTIVSGAWDGQILLWRKN